MREPFDIQSYMTRGVERVVSDAVRATLKNPRESAFMARFVLASRSASKKRREMEERGEHIPPFLIASITSRCNLHCAGCYSRCNQATTDMAPVRQVTSEEWLKIFEEADDLGISFILLAGGEPLIRRDIIEAAGKRPNILFPVFTNGTFMDEQYFELFDRCRNLVPIMSIEGENAITDARRGAGVYDRLIANMDELHRRGLIFGASVTVTTQNIREVSSSSFLQKLSDRGCKAVIFAEFVPVTDDSKDLAPGEAEPCPFSPYSDINVRDTSLRDALKSPLFLALQDGGVLLDDHEGGCVLYEKREQVEAILSQSREYIKNGSTAGRKDGVRL